jgi:hypothetical protein
MKQFFFYVFLMICLSGCGAASAPGGGKSNCDHGVCIQISAVEPIQFDSPVSLMLTVTSDKDQEIDVTLQAFPPVVFEEPKEKNIVSANTKDQGISSWVINQVKANTPITLSVSARMSEETLYHFMAYASTLSKKATNEITIQYLPSSPKAYMAGTEVPVTPGPIPTYRGPTPTFNPTKTNLPTQTPIIKSPTPKSTATNPPRLTPSATPNTLVTPTLPAYPASAQ